MIPTKETPLHDSQPFQNIRFKDFGERHPSEGNPDYLPKRTLSKDNLKKLILKAKNKEPAEKESYKLTSTQRLLQKIISVDKAPKRSKTTTMKSAKAEQSKSLETLQRIPRKILLNDKFFEELNPGEEPLKNWQIIKKRNPRLWKSGSEVTLKVITVAMKPPKKLRDNWSEAGDARLYHVSHGLKRISPLRNLNLNLTELGSEGLKSLCGGLKRLNSLENISISLINSRVSDKEIGRLAHILKRFPRLKRLNLGFSGCQKLTHEGLERVAESFQRLRALEHLGLELSSCVNITDNTLYMLRNWLKKLKFLRSFSLSFSCLENITNQGMIYLQNNLANYGKSLKSIDFRFDLCSKITNQALVSMSQGIKDLTCLEDTYLYFSRGSEIDSLGIKAIIQALKDLKDLKSIDLNLASLKGEKNCFATVKSPKSLSLKIKLGDQELQYLGQTLLESFTFQALNLSFVDCFRLTDAGLKDLGSRFGRFIMLDNLQLQFTNCESVTSQGFLQICEGLQTLNSLQNFSLSVVKPTQLLSGFGIYGLCEVLKSFSKLKSFCLDCDLKVLSLKGLRALCETLEGIDSLERVYLRSNRLVGLKIIEVYLSGQKEIQESLSVVISRFINIELNGNGKDQMLLELFEGIRKVKG